MTGMRTEGLSSRDIALTASTGCPRLAAAAAHGRSGRRIAEQLDAPMPVVSQIAFLAGGDFERRVVSSREDYKRLRDTLRVTGGIHDFGDRLADDEMAAELPGVLADPAIELVLQAPLAGLLGQWHRPDLLQRTPDGGWMVGEIKAYLDRGGDTDPHMTASAVTQAAVAVVAARRLGLKVSSTVRLVFSDLSMNPVVHDLRADAEIAQIERLLSATVSPKAEDPMQQPHVWGPVCRGRCPLDPVCAAEVAAQPGRVFLTDRINTRHGLTHVEALGKITSGDDSLAGRALRAGWHALDLIPGPTNGESR